MRGIILLYGLFISCVASAQVMDYFLNDPEWLETSSCMQGSGDCMLNTTYVYYVEGDTDVVATGELYKKIRVRGKSEYITEDTLITGLCEGSFNFDHLAAILRQDGRKIIMYDPDGEEEVLLYDFSLTEGATLPVTPIQPNPDIYVTEIDSFYIGFNYIRKFYLSTPEPTYIIEGIGSNYGFLEDLVVDSACIYSHGCYSRYDEVYWSISSTLPTGLRETISSLVDCDFSVGFVQEAEQPKLIVYPNPATSTLHIDGIELDDYTACISDMSGRIVFEQKLNGDLLDISGLEHGNYVLRLSNALVNTTVRFSKL